MRLIDAGCGGGLLAASLSRLGAEVVALDSSTKTIEFAERVANDTLSSDVLRRLQFKCMPIEDFAESNTNGKQIFGY